MATQTSSVQPTSLVRKPDDARSVFVVGRISSGSPQFGAYDEAETWCKANVAGGTVDIIELTWCERCQEFTAKCLVRGRWVTDCVVCDQEYMQRWLDDRQRLAHWIDAAQQFTSESSRS
jgi:hypothetical protein